MSDGSKIPDLRWSPTTRMVFWAAEENGWCSTDLVARRFYEILPADAVKLGDVNGLRAEIRAVLDDQGPWLAFERLRRIKDLIERVSPQPDIDIKTEQASAAQWKAAYEQKLADFARETLRTSELIRQRDDLRHQLDALREPSTEDRYAEGDQVEIYTVGRWEPADICRDYGGDRIEARTWGHMMHTCRREDVRRRPSVASHD